MLEPSASAVSQCPGCGTEIASHFLICPNCHRLVHADSLKRLADEAGLAEQSGDLTASLVAWRSAMELLPPKSRQFETISKKVAELGDRVDATPGLKRPEPAGSKSGWAGAGGVAGLGTLGLMLWKFKFLALLIATKGKLLLLGLTKASTLFSMFLTAGVYWSLWGWKFAVGLVVTTYIHEMGHVAALVRYGIKADAPMFIPGVGALIRARQRLANPREEAQVGLGGPIWGAGSVAACFGLYFATGQLVFAGIARLAAIINLFNLIPIWQLDGGHAFRAFSKSQRWLAAASASVMWALTASTNEIPYTFLFIIMLCAAYQAVFDPPSKEPDALSVAEYVGLVVGLSLATQVPVPLP